MLRIAESQLRFIEKMVPDDFVFPDRIVITKFKIPLNVEAIGAYDKTSGIMFINSKYDSEEKIYKYLNTIPGYFANTELYSLYAHELGHKYYCDRINHLAFCNKMSYNDAEKVVKRKLNSYIKSEYPDEQVISSAISIYAYIRIPFYNYNEFVAESFAGGFVDNIDAKNVIKFLRSVTLK